MNEPLVLIPEAMCDARYFAAQMAAFSADRAVMVAPITQATGIREMGRAVLDAAPAKFALAGAGMGAMVAMEVLRRAPERVMRIALLSATPLAETPQGSADLEALLVGAKTGQMDATLRAFFPGDHLAPGAQRLEVINLLVAMGLSLGADVFERQIRALQRRPDQQGTLRRCKIPALVMCGEHDTLTPPKRHEFMAELIPSARFAQIEGAGHFPTLEQPEATTQALQDWLRQPYVLR